MSRCRRGSASGLFTLAAVLWNSSALAQDELLKDLFPGARLSDQFSDAGTDLHVSAHSPIEAGGREYIAVTYYEPYPDGANRHASFALLERSGAEYRTLLDQVAADDGSDLEFQKPFKYTVNAQELVVFPKCYRGCRYSYFRLGPTPTRITIEDYGGLGADESFSGRGELSHFGANGLSTTFSMERNGDASCCPSGGTLSVFYELRGDRFQISRVERHAPVAETRSSGNQAAMNLGS